MAFRRCVTCPGRTNQDRIQCARCVLEAKRKARGPRPRGRAPIPDLTPDEIEKRFAAAKARMRRRAA